MTDLQSPTQPLLYQYHQALAELAGGPIAMKGEFSTHHLPWWYVLTTLKDALNDYTLGIEGDHILVGNNLDSIKRAFVVIGDEACRPTSYGRDHRISFAPWVRNFESSIWKMEIPEIFTDVSEDLLRQFLDDLNALAERLGTHELPELIRVPAGKSGRRFVSANMNAVTGLGKHRSSGDYLEFPPELTEECQSIFGSMLRPPEGGLFYMRPYLRLIATRINLGEIPQVFSD